MNLEDLRAVRSRERSSDSLQDLRDSFYEEVADYIQSRKDERERAAAASDDPFSSEEVQTLTDEIETAEQVSEAIYERRMGKIVKQASLAAAGMTGDTEGLTNEERRLYDDLVARIEENKSHVLDVLAGDADPREEPASDATGADPMAASHANPEPDSMSGDGESEPAPTERAESSAAAAMGGGLDEADDAPDDTPSPDARNAEGSAGADGAEGAARTTVRITRDVGDVFGVDERQYSLEAEDVVVLPAENAKPLVEKDAAEEL
ncbi:hypothetical protein [Salarchaeum sp. JOR-1]|uniref:hypothetical protein n=1 Tax=Salarchaeum sp. JOR-1 TaxID=2599399 RepID=UPI0011988D4B|nr:hypothetical protein [Salarchaeum sp. JOR-1]QDX41607.1 hypothetical protein FQU85_12085 [Salarchaeum sp. JOR-1]